MVAIISILNANQNKVVRLFLVSSVALLPPVLIASIYGKNFAYMPELNWSLGYPFALLLMALSVVVPFWIFYQKGWLNIVRYPASYLEFKIAMKHSAGALDNPLQFL